MRTHLDDVGIFSKAYTGAGTTFGRLDRFNRTTISSWTRDLTTDRDIYKLTLGYDRDSNITFQEDEVQGESLRDLAATTALSVSAGRPSTGAEVVTLLERTSPTYS